MQKIKMRWATNNSGCGHFLVNEADLDQSVIIFGIVNDRDELRSWHAQLGVASEKENECDYPAQEAKRRCEKWLTKQFAKMGIEVEVVG